MEHFLFLTEGVWGRGGQDYDLIRARKSQSNLLEGDEKPPRWRLLWCFGYDRGIHINRLLHL
jgi:hypothetical protein